MTKTLLRLGHALVAALTLGAGGASAVVDGITGPTFNLTAKVDYITAGDGSSLLTWGYAADAAGPFPGVMQYPGPTLIVNEGDEVTVNLRNALPMAASMVFPGQSGVTTSCDDTIPAGTPGLLTCEAPPDGTTTVTYTFTASQPGTYLYHSGTRPDLQVEMGLVGAIIVRPAGFDETTKRTAYGDAGSAYDHEYLFLLTEMDFQVHQQVAVNMMSGAAPDAGVDTADVSAEYWFINGRASPDTMMAAGAGTPWMPTQPYNAMPRMFPGDRLLMRVIGGGRDLHPLHHHGNNTWTIARDGRLLESVPGSGIPDLAVSDFTLKVVPGSTYDAIFEWTGKGLGWDIYGHAETDPLQPNEYAPDHGKPLPVALPNQQDLAFGGFWSGSPYLGAAGALPPGQGGLNANAGYFHMWHSHTEKEITNNDIFPGGMMTMVIIEPRVDGVTIP
ncbi:MAG: multicopper oxidase domain-containing protein [Thiobacillus sp.]